MPWPIKILLVSMFLAIFVGALILSVKNQANNGFFVFSKMDWVDRFEDEFEFKRQTYMFPITSGLISFFAIFQILRS
jgi:hypothetical protein